MRGRVESPKISSDTTVAELVEMLSSTAFNARRLSEAAKICEEMVKSDSFVFLTLAGAMIPAGMRGVVAGMVENGFINALVTTGANIVHEVAEALGYGHLIGSSYVDDVELSESNLNRIYDVYIEQEAFEGVENFISSVLEDMSGKMASYEFIREIGSRIPDNNSFLKIAYEKNVPVFCPTLHDSIIGLHVMIYRKEFEIDFFRDVKKMLDLCFENKRSGVVVVGGGVPKNFTLQAMLLADGFDYAVQITTDSPQFGGLSGATLEEAKSWCKLKAGAKAVTVYCDATIALPMIYAYLLSKLGGDE